MCSDLLKIGLDIGSTTVKCVVLDDDNNIIYKTYERHYSQITEKISELLKRVKETVTNADDTVIAMSGSAGMGIADACGIDFIQEVYATRVAANTFLPNTDVIIELGYFFGYLRVMPFVNLIYEPVLFIKRGAFNGSRAYIKTDL